MSLLTIHFSSNKHSNLEYVATLLQQKLLDSSDDHIHTEDLQKAKSASCIASSYPINIEIYKEGDTKSNTEGDMLSTGPGKAHINEQVDKQSDAVGDVESSTSSIMITPQLPQFQLLLHGTPLYSAAAYALGQYIVEVYEEEIIQALLRHRCRQTSLNPKRVAQYCYNILNNDPWEPLGRKFSEQDRARRRNKIVEELILYFEHHTHIDVDGYINFRMHSYKQELQEVMEYAIDEYVMDQQYEEFMTLLKYFVQLQETKVELVHLVQQEGSSFMLCDDQMKPLELKHEHDRIVAEMLETEINVEDIVISSLISASPQKIIVHAKHQEYQVIRTVKAIFAERAQLCRSCSICHHSREELIPFQ